MSSQKELEFFVLLFSCAAFFGVGGLFLLFIRLAMGIFSESTFLAFITER